MNPHKRELLAFLRSQEREPFSVSRRLDSRRRLDRNFPADLPLILSLQSYPGYRQMVGENWMHWHDYYECWVATEGCGEYRCGHHQFPFGPGDLVVVDPLKIHGVLRMEKSHTPLVIFFRAEAVAGAESILDRGFLAAWERRHDRTSPRLKADSAAAGPVFKALLRLAQVWFAQGDGEDRHLTLKLHLLELLMALRRAYLAQGDAGAEPNSLRAEQEGRLSRVLEYVAKHCHSAVPQPEVARIAGMSSSRFRAFFKQTTGWGFADYLRDLRLERAARLLRETDASIAEVAYRTGFADQSHLQRLFKSKHGISPLAYRKRHLSECNGA